MRNRLAKILTMTAFFAGLAASAYCADVQTISATALDSEKLYPVKAGNKALHQNWIDQGDPCFNLPVGDPKRCEKPTFHGYSSSLAPSQFKIGGFDDPKDARPDVYSGTKGKAGNLGVITKPEGPMDAKKESLGIAGSVHDNYKTDAMFQNKTGKPLLGDGTQAFGSVDGAITGSGFGFVGGQSKPFVWVSPNASSLNSATGDLSFTARYDTTVAQGTPNGSPNGVVTNTSSVSGICQNGLIRSCLWVGGAPQGDCTYLRWQVSQVGALQLTNTCHDPIDGDRTCRAEDLAGCFCINKSCGSGIVARNLPEIMMSLAGGIQQAYIGGGQGYVISEVSSVSGADMIFSGQRYKPDTKVIGTSDGQTFTPPTDPTATGDEPVRLKMVGSDNPAKYYQDAANAGTDPLMMAATALKDALTGHDEDTVFGLVAHAKGAGNGSMDEKTCSMNQSPDIPASPIKVVDGPLLGTEVNWGMSEHQVAGASTNDLPTLSYLATFKIGGGGGNCNFVSGSCQQKKFGFANFWWVDKTITDTRTLKLKVNRFERINKVVIKIQNVAVSKVKFSANGAVLYDSSLGTTYNQAAAEAAAAAEDLAATASQEMVDAKTAYDAAAAKAAAAVPPNSALTAEANAAYALYVDKKAIYDKAEADAATANAAAGTASNKSWVMNSNEALALFRRNGEIDFDVYATYKGENHTLDVSIEIFYSEVCDVVDRVISNCVSSELSDCALWKEVRDGVKTVDLGHDALTPLPPEARWIDGSADTHCRVKYTPPAVTPWWSITRTYKCPPHNVTPYEGMTDSATKLNSVMASSKVVMNGTAIVGMGYKDANGEVQVTALDMAQNSECAPACQVRRRIATGTDGRQAVGTCSVSTSMACLQDTDCPTGEVCNAKSLVANDALNSDGRTAASILTSTALASRSETILLPCTDEGICPINQTTDELLIYTEVPKKSFCKVNVKVECTNNPAACPAPDSCDQKFTSRNTWIKTPSAAQLKAACSCKSDFFQGAATIAVVDSAKDDMICSERVQ